MTTNIQIYNKTPGIWEFPGQVLQQGEKSFGICDPSLLGKARQGAEPYRWATAYFELTLAGGDLSLAAGASYVIFDKGATESATAIGALTPTDSDLYAEGAMVKGGQVYIVKAFGVQVLTPFVLSAAGEKQYTTWIEAYKRRIMEAFYDNVAMSYEFDGEDCKGDLGMIKFWPQHASLQGDGQVYNGDAMGPASVTPLRRPIITGGKDATDKIEVTLKTGHTFAILEDATFPIPDLEEGETILVPIQVIVYGQPECGIVCMPACLLPNGTIQTVAVNGMSNAQIAAQAGI